MSVTRRAGADFLNDDKGGSLLGYALMIGLVLLAVYGAAGYQSGGQWNPTKLFTMPTWWKMPG